MTMTNFVVVTTDVDFGLPNLAQLIDPILPATIITAACFVLWWRIARKFRNVS